MLIFYWNEALKEYNIYQLELFHRNRPWVNPLCDLNPAASFIRIDFDRLYPLKFSVFHFRVFEFRTQDEMA